MQSQQISCHLRRVLSPEFRAKTIKWVIKQLKPYVDDFDAIAVCGASCLLIGPTVADKLKKNIILVRKECDWNQQPEDGGSHSDHEVEGPRDGRYVIIDDLTETGKTLFGMMSAINNFCEYSKCTGVVLYGFGDYPKGRRKCENQHIAMGKTRLSKCLGPTYSPFLGEIECSQVF